MPGNARDFFTFGFGVKGIGELRIGEMRGGDQDIAELFE